MERPRLGGTVEVSKSISDRQLLQTASKGSALRGVLFSKNFKDRLEERNFLLQLPDHVALKSASKCEDRFENFTSQFHEDEYRRKVDFLGLSGAVSLKVPLVSASASGSATKNQMSKYGQSLKTTYYSTVKYSTTQLGSYEFEKYDMKLSRGAKTELQKVLRLLEIHGPENGFVKESCREFFRSYGSHAYTGPFSFGGHYWWVSSTKSFNSQEFEAVKEIQSKSISASIEAGCGGYSISADASISKIKQSYEGLCSKTTLSNTSTCTIISGGPIEAQSFQRWKSGITVNRNTWIIIDRGTHQPMPVWDIIRENHKELGALITVLIKTWEEMSGLKAKVMPALTHYDAKSELEMISKWNKEKKTSPQIVLDRLHKVKISIMESTGNRRIWINDYLLKSPLQNFFLSMLQLKKGAIFKRLKFYINLLIDQEDCTYLSDKNFPGFDKLITSLHLHSSSTQLHVGGEITSLETFIAFLEEMLSRVKIAQLSSASFLEDTALSDDINVEVTTAIFWLQNFCKKKYDNVLITILLYNFQSNSLQENITFLKQITFKNLQDMYQKFSDQRIVFFQYEQQKKTVLLQAYLFHLAMNLVSDAKELCNLLNHVKKMMTILKPPLEKFFNELICEASFKSLKSLRDTLDKILATGHFMPTSSSSIQTRNACALKHVLQTEALPSHPQPAIRTSVLTKNPDAHDLFKKLGLCCHYPQKMTLESALHIRKEVLELSLGISHPKNSSQLPYLILHKLMSYDCQCRSDLMHPEYSIQKTHSKSESDSDSSEDDSDDDDDDDDDMQIHPVDSLLAVLFCCDDFLRQDLFSRLAKCQLSVPFVLCDPFTKQLTLPLWAMRSISKDFYHKGMKKKYPVVKYKMPIISFVRIGKLPQICLSQILNEVISGSNHKHFFHHNCRGGQYKSLLVDGLVDMCWFLPSGKITDTFPTAITFLNLHGDARQHREQMKFLCQISSMCFIHLTEMIELDEDFKQILKLLLSNSGEVVLLNEVGENHKRYEENGIKMHNVKMKRKNPPQMKDSIVKQIRKKLDSSIQLKSIEDCCSSENKRVLVDEKKNNSYLQQGLKMGHDVVSKIVRDKKSMIPLQDHWRRWSSQDKEYYRQKRMGSKRVNVYADEVKTTMSGIRKEQLECAKSPTPLMESFIISLLKLHGPYNQVSRSYFLQTIKMNLDLLSLEVVGEKQALYEKAKDRLAELTSIKSGDNKSAISIELCKKEMKKHMQDITDASFGLEHLFRELGQIFEAAKSSSEFGAELSCLPKVAAELLIEGYPLELMDGDAAHVPMTWITAVIEEAVHILSSMKKIEHPHIYVLSVLGIQSSGKSTMLNSVFGLQFNVGTGRCTRGAFMHLLPVEKELREQTKVSHVMVVDSEGLRAPEQDQETAQEHDNELATFVIGLANITLINIMGEVAADINDILQTSIHAFLRMKLTGSYKPRCQFIHQNAESSKNNDISRGNFTEKLNEFTALASEAENLAGIYDSFDDVISFDDRKDVHYFPGLWKGDAIMAPVNQGYSDCAQQLKLSLIESLSQRTKDGSTCSLSLFPTKLEDYWSALLKEDFVFSFRNTQEITVYSNLEQEYMKIEWGLKGKMLDWEHKAGNEISGASGNVSQIVKESLVELGKHLSEEEKSSKSQLEKLFNDENSEIVIKWQHEFERRFEKLINDLENHARKHCKDLEESKKAIYSIEKDRENYTKIVTEKVHEYVAKINSDREKLNKNLEKGELQPTQLDKLLQHDFFSPEKLSMYSHLTPGQNTRICELVQESDGRLTRSTLNKIISLLSPEQAIKIFIKEPTEEQLEVQFDAIWIDIINHLQVKETKSLDVAGEVEGTLRDFVQSKGGHAGQLRDKLKNNPLRNWGIFLQLVPIENAHYVKPGFLRRGKEFLGYQKGTFEIAQDVTGKLLKKAELCLLDITKKNSGFNPAYTDKLLQKVSEEITAQLESSDVKGHITFKQEYFLEIYLVVCSYAIPKFEIMSKNFLERHNPKLYLQKYVKKPLCSDFKSKFRQIKADEAIAKKLCACLEEPIKEQIEKTTVAKVVDLLRCEPQFSSKMALKVKILTDLFQKDRFELYMSYIKDVEKSIRYWLLTYVMEHCDMQESEEGTRLQILLKRQVSQIIELVEEEVNRANKTRIDECLKTFCNAKKLRRQLGDALNASDLQKGFESVSEINLEHFKAEVRAGLEQLKLKLFTYFCGITCRKKLGHWEKQLLDKLEDIIGCTEQCPFCKEQCDYLDPNHYSSGNRTQHHTKVHRPDCLGSYRRSKDNTMTIDMCPSLVAGNSNFKCKATKDQYHPYNEYDKVYPEWSIPPDKTSKNSLYWMRFVGRYKNAIAEEYSAEPPEVPKGWADYTWDEVKQNLKEMYNYEAV